MKNSKKIRANCHSLLLFFVEPLVKSFYNMCRAATGNLWYETSYGITPNKSVCEGAGFGNVLPESPPTFSQSSYVKHISYLGIRIDPEIQAYFRQHQGKNEKTVIVKIAHSHV